MCSTACGMKWSIDLAMLCYARFAALLLLLQAAHQEPATYLTRKSATCHRAGVATTQLQVCQVCQAAKLVRQASERNCRPNRFV